MFKSFVDARLRNIIDYLFDVPTLSEESERHRFRVMVFELTIMLGKLGGTFVENSKGRLEKKLGSAIAVVMLAVLPCTYPPCPQKGAVCSNYWTYSSVYNGSTRA